MGDWTEYTRFLTALLVILDPFAAIPLFLALTQGHTVVERARVALITSTTVAIVLIISALSGETLLHWMGTSLASFRVGGGVVLFLMAFAMLRGQPMEIRTTPDENSEAETKATIAVVPLGLPLLAGPGSISTVIIEMHRFDAFSHSLLVVLTILFVCAVLWLVLRLAGRIATAIGHIGLNIINRLFGLILTAIAVEIMANGLRELFPMLAQVS
ncbi:MarC family protein [Kaarinaea lacus]